MECISCCRPRLNLTLNISPYVGTDDSRWPSLSRVTAFASTTKHLTVCTRRQTCQRSLIDIQMYACTSSKFDHPYREEGIVGLSTVKVFGYKWHTPTYTKACIRTLPGKAPALEVAAVTHSAFEANSYAQKCFRQNPWPPHQPNLAVLSWGIQISRSLSVMCPERDGDSEMGPVRKTHPPARQAESIADLAMARKREAVKTQRRDSTGAYAAVPLRSIFNASNSTSAKGMHNYRFLNNSWGAHLNKEVHGSHLCAGNFSICCLVEPTF